MQKMHLRENGSSIYAYVFMLSSGLHLCITVDECRKQKAAPEYPLGGSSGEGIPAPIVPVLCDVVGFCVRVAETPRDGSVFYARARDQNHPLVSPALFQ